MLPLSIIEIYIQKNLYALNEKPHIPGPHLLGRIHDLSHVHSAVTLVTGVFIILLLIPLAMKEPNNKSLAKITNLIPTTTILIILGIISGIITHFAEETFENGFSPVIITADVFQHILIFPILLYTSYRLYHQDFLRQWKSISILGLLGPILNVLLSASILFLINYFLWMKSMTMAQTIAFTACLSVEDPLAIAAVFKQVRNKSGNQIGNFYLPYGVALLGYGVSMELFKGGKTLAVFGEDDEDLPLYSYLYVVSSKITDSLFGIFTGVIFGLVSAAITRITSYKSQYFEPVITIGCALLGYLLCVICGFSYILATIFCGLVQQRYTFMNMAPKSSMNTENIIYGISLVCELSLYILVGYLVVHVEFSYVFIFACVSIIIIYTIRLLVTVGLSLLLNLSGLTTIFFKWQMLLFAGQKGPMSLAMAVAYTGPFNKLFLETILIVIVFSHLVDGVISRYLATKFKLRIDEKQPESAVDDFLVLSSIYGGAELSKLLGVDVATNRINFFHLVENCLLRFLITDKDKMSGFYRIHAEEEQRQFFEKLEKHGILRSAKQESVENVRSDKDIAE